MPRRLPSPCAQPRCPALCLTRYCPEHQRETTRAYDRGRGSAASRGYGARHRRWRELVLARDPVCVDPFGDHAAAGEVVASTDADHKVRIIDGGKRFDLENGQGLCATCHGKKTAVETRAKPHAGTGGWVLRAARPCRPDCFLNGCDLVGCRLERERGPGSIG